MEVKDIVENTRKIYMSESSLEILMDYERVIDDLDIYAFKNWTKGELVEGPIKNRHWVEATFMWPYKLMPDPDGGKRLTEYRIQVEFSKDKLVSPVKVESPDDFRPGTRKPKLKEEPVWLVRINMPVELIADIREGFIELEGREIDLKDLDDAYDQNIEDTTSMDSQQANNPGEEDDTTEIQI
jgi:hypothetical protein